MAEHQPSKNPNPPRENLDAGRTDERKRGRHARYPWQIPWRGWKDILLRVREESGKDNLGIVSAGVAFYAFLSLFPALLAIFSIYGIMSDPNDVAGQVSRLTNIAPEPTRQFLQQELTRLADVSGGALGWGTVLGLAGALWGSARAIKAMMTGLNVVYEEHEERGYIKVNLIGLFMTLCILVGAVIALVGIIGVPIVLGAVGLEGIWPILLDIARWPLLALVGSVVLAVVYRWGPDRCDAQWKWITPGATLATLVWLVASWLFSYFVSHFGNYANTYGSLAAVIVLMFWLSLSAQIALLGAEVDAEMEHQTAKDSTVPPDKEMGNRGAKMADTLGESHKRDKDKEDEE